MRAVVQRVSEAAVTVSGEPVGRIGQGLLVLVGVRVDDTRDDANAIADKVVGLRVFEDDAGRMNRSVLEAGGEVLAVSQFTLYGDARNGRRPSFSDAAPGEMALPLFEAFTARLGQAGVRVELGRFGAHMKVSLTNDGPVTLLLDSRRQF